MTWIAATGRTARSRWLGAQEGCSELRPPVLQSRVASEALRPGRYIVLTCRRRVRDTLLPGDNACRSHTMHC
eukprot:Skav218407  [mRNA]  locus=scaffold1349:116872:121435:- [translate_table: standard]